MNNHRINRNSKPRNRLAKERANRMSRLLYQRAVKQREQQCNSWREMMEKRASSRREINKRKDDRIKQCREKIDFLKTKLKDEEKVKKLFVEQTKTLQAFKVKYDDQKATIALHDNTTIEKQRQIVKMNTTIDELQKTLTEVTQKMNTSKQEQTKVASELEAVVKECTVLKEKLKKTNNNIDTQVLDKLGLGLQVEAKDKEIGRLRDTIYLLKNKKKDVRDSSPPLKVSPPYPITRSAEKRSASCNKQTEARVNKMKTPAKRGRKQTTRAT